jgi:predicted AlkP superfamily phosphohydrolase/phosphomutase
MSHAGQRLVVIGLDCVPPEFAFERFDLPCLHSLVSRGAHGRLESIVPPITVPAWACMVTGQDPGALGIYGFRNRADYGYRRLALVNSRSVNAPAVWDILAQTGRRSIVLGVPPSYPPKAIRGLMVSCFMTPDASSAYTWPPELKPELEQRFGPYLFDVADFRTEDKSRLLEQVYRVTEQRFAISRYLLQTKAWDFFMLMDIGPDRLHHGFWKFCDPQHRQYTPGNPFRQAFADYYRFLDEQIGRVLELLDDRTSVLVVSDHGAKRMDGAICLNEWLIREGYLTLKTYPYHVTPFEGVEVDWARTVAWGEGGYYGRIFLNVRGREPQGVVTPSEYEAVRDELIRKLEGLGDETGQSIGTRVYRPEDLYPVRRGIPPDLIAIFGDSYWRSAGSVGVGSIWSRENDTGPDDANHAQHGMVIGVGVELEAIGDAYHILHLQRAMLRVYGLTSNQTVAPHRGARV